MPSPDLVSLLRKYNSVEDPAALYRLLGRSDLDDSPYLHWDQLRHRVPPTGLTSEQWWLALRMRRSQSARELALYQASGEPFTYVLTDKILKAGEEISRRAGGSRERTPGTSPSGRETFMVHSLVEEAMTSSQLEGAVTSRREAKDLLESGRDPRDKSELMILNNYEAMRRANEVAAQPLSPEIVRELHAILTEGTLDDPADAGRVQQPGEVRVAVYDQRERITHSPPPAEQLEDRLQQLCAFANADQDQGTYVPSVIRAIVVHFMFGYDHYFADGNGRTARTAFFWSMLNSGHWLTEYLAISRILKQAPGKYATAYEYTEDDDGDLTYFIHHQLDVILRALDDLDSYLDVQKKRHEARTKELEALSANLNFRQLDVMERLSSGSLRSITSAAFADHYRVSQQTARTDLSGLAGRGLLTSRPGRRRTRHWSLPPSQRQ
jgi:Fic family protein